MDIHIAACDGDLSAVQAAVKRGDDVNSMEVSWFCGSLMNQPPFHGESI